MGGWGGVVEVEVKVGGRRAERTGVVKCHPKSGDRVFIKS